MIFADGFAVKGWMLKGLIGLWYNSSSLKLRGCFKVHRCSNNTWTSRSKILDEIKAADEASVGSFTIWRSFGTFWVVRLLLAFTPKHTVFASLPSKESRAQNFICTASLSVNLHRRWNLHEHREVAWTACCDRCDSPNLTKTRDL